MTRQSFNECEMHQQRARAYTHCHRHSIVLFFSIYLSICIPKCASSLFALNVNYHLAEDFNFVTKTILNVYQLNCIVRHCPAIYLETLNFKMICFEVHTGGGVRMTKLAVFIQNTCEIPFGPLSAKFSFHSLWLFELRIPLLMLWWWM